MTTFTHVPNIAIEIRRCYDCHRWFGFEAGDLARCPHCAIATTDMLHKQIQELERKTAALKGALTKAKKP